MRPATTVVRRLALLIAVLVAAGTAGVILPLHPAPAHAAPINQLRFARLSFGASGKSALSASALRDSNPALPDEYRTPNGWRLRPAGEQIETPRAPTGVAVSPDGSTAVTLSSGLVDNSLVVVDTATLAWTRTGATDLFMGLAIDGANNLWASTGNRNRVYQYAIAGGKATGTRQVDRIDPFPPYQGIETVGYPGNMVLGDDGRLYVVGNLSVPESFIKQTDPKAGNCPQGAPAGKPICSVVNVLDVSDPVAPTIPNHLVPVGRDAYGVAFNPKAKTLYVSNWADETNRARGGGRGTVSVVDVSTKGQEHEVGVVRVGHHPTGIALAPDGSRLVVANAEDDTISVLSLRADGSVSGARTFSVKPTLRSPTGGTPLAVAYSAKGDRLFVVLAGQNAVEVRRPNGAALPRKVTVHVGGERRVIRVPHTYIPTGWYPSAIAVGPEPGGQGTRIYVTNLKGIGAGPGENGQAEPLVGERTEGMLQVVTLNGSASALGKQLDSWTATVIENNAWTPLFDRHVRSAANNPCRPAPLPNGKTTFSPLLCRIWKGKVPARPLHVVYVVKENKTFDQFFGDINAFGVPDADADPSWLLYGNDVTTNQHRLAARYSLSDNFWADAEQSTTGHSWTSAGYVTEYNEITWNPEYAEGVRGARWEGAYDYTFQAGGCDKPEDGCDPDIATQEKELFDPEVRLVDLFASPKVNKRGATYRIYSDDVNQGSKASGQRIPLSVWGIGPSAVHHGRDLDFPDTDRMGMFLHGHTVSNAWSGCDVTIAVCTGPPDPPPPSYHKEIGLCGAPNDKDVEDAAGTFCKRSGSLPTEYERFSLDAWKASYRSCRKTGGSDRKCQLAMPNFLYMALPIDHTLGFNPNQPTPASMVANNDQATGELVQALSKSPFWKNTIVFITEDDTQLAGDHVDAHRTFLLTAGGLARRWGRKGKASHQGGSFPSILKTIEVLFRLPALSIFDRSAVPLHDVIVKRLSQRSKGTYQAVKPQTSFARNPSTGILARISAALNWNGVDQINTEVLNDLLYHYYKGWPLRQRDYGVLRGTVSGSGRGVDDH